jgi:hypothetical protein
MLRKRAVVLPLPALSPSGGPIGRIDTYRVLMHKPQIANKTNERKSSPSGEIPSSKHQNPTRFQFPCTHVPGFVWFLVLGIWNS